MKARLDTSRIAWFAILAIMWHAFMPLLHASGMSQDMLSSICSTGEPRQELIQLPSGKQDAPAAELLKQCPLCASGAHFAVADEAAPRFVPDASRTRPVLSIFRCGQACFRLAELLSPRTAASLIPLSFSDLLPR